MNSKQITGAAWWNAEGRIARLVELHESGMSFSRIAAEMDTTKNTVLGKANRMGLRRRVALVKSPVPVSRITHEPPDRNSCAWPLWGNEVRPVYAYCCSPVAVSGASYCPDHMVAAHQRRPAA